MQIVSRSFGVTDRPICDIPADFAGANDIIGEKAWDWDKFTLHFMIFDYH